MHGIQAVLFDYDDTLVKTRECKFAALIALAERHYGHALPNAEIEAHWGIPYRALFARLFASVDADVERVIQRYEALNDECTRETQGRSGCSRSCGRRVMQSPSGNR